MSVAAFRHDPISTRSYAEVVEVADMLDRLAAADVQLTVRTLDDLLARLRPALAVRQRLADVAPETLRAALLLRRTRAHGLTR